MTTLASEVENPQKLAYRIFTCQFLVSSRQCHDLLTLQRRDWKQESCAIAKMTAQCPHATYTRMPWNFRDSLTTPIATIPNIFHGLLFRSKLWMFVQNLKSVALPVPGIIGGTLKIWSLPGYAHALFSPKFLMGFYSDWPCKCTRQIWSP